jgi:uncharacterized protein YejL (UPF0352 family)
MEHPEEYSDEQIEKLMSDLDNEETYNLMVDAENVYREDDLSDEKIDGEWNKLTAKGVKSHHRSVFRIAASVIGLAMLSGIIYATIAICSHHGENRVPIAEGKTTASSSKQEAIQTDTTNISKPVIKEYRDAKLETVIGEMAAYYNKEVSFANDRVRSIRIYIKWNQSDSLRETIDKLNHFDKFTISMEDDKIIVQ